MFFSFSFYDEMIDTAQNLKLLIKFKITKLYDIYWALLHI